LEEQLATASLNRIVRQLVRSDSPGIRPSKLSPSVYKLTYGCLSDAYHFGHSQVLLPHILLYMLSRCENISYTALEMAGLRLNDVLQPIVHVLTGPRVQDLPEYYREMYAISHRLRSAFMRRLGG
jgi:hypothetical protein